MKFFARIAAGLYDNNASVLDLGCGAGNYSLSLLEFEVGKKFTLVDLSNPMLLRAKERLSQFSISNITTTQDDIRNITLKQNSFEIVVVASVLHHLREKEEWEDVFKNIYNSLKPVGMFFVYDLVVHDLPKINQILNNDYGDFLKEKGGEAYKNKMFDYIAIEDSPRSINYQLELMQNIGFSYVDLVHKKAYFGAFLGIK